MAETKTKSKSGLISHGIASQNRKARFDYTIKETVEAGLVLKGPEVKSLRHGRATLTEAWAGEKDGELYLFNCYIPEYQGGVLSRFPRGYYFQAIIKFNLGQAEQAVEAAGKYMARNPGDPDGVKLMSRIDLAVQRPDHAIQILDAAAVAGLGDCAAFVTLRVAATAVRIPAGRRWRQGRQGWSDWCGGVVVAFKCQWSGGGGRRCRGGGT